MSFFGKPTGGEPRITYERIDLTADGAVLPPSRPEPTIRQPPVLRAAPPASTPVVRAKGAEQPPMLIAADSEMEGRLRSRGAVRVEGVLRGELHAASLILEPGGLIEGLVTVEHAQLNGTLRGSVVAKDIEIARTALVEAELVYEEIGIERGARVRGLHRRREPEPQPEPEALSVSVTSAIEAEATAQTAALVAAAEAALQELAEVAQAAAGASAELAQDGVASLVALEDELRDTAARLPMAEGAR
ncbi:polymer-forming cytoskeletal protein [Roseomonas aerophila]|uniref:Polymer-forming cytoskeletal protein n=1 Tax=Teichococcus aerophilus TaxID=1224513 RepID=A0ABR7RMA5_9PROT|nr:polymer-forming cytoskeletal protein [Pseudoroseomonas aerophila]MBC9207741.1 polymer-forming cytoskeletal protein [Pseudoroseomonas aerophila]